MIFLLEGLSVHNLKFTPLVLTARGCIISESPADSDKKEGDAPGLASVETAYKHRDLLAALSDTTSFKELPGVLGVSQPTVSYHIKKLKEAGLADVIRDESDARAAIIIKKPEGSVAEKYIGALIELDSDINWGHAGDYLFVMSELEKDPRTVLTEITSNTGVSSTVARRSVNMLERAAMLEVTRQEYKKAGYKRELTDKGREALRLLQDVYNPEKKPSEEPKPAVEKPAQGAVEEFEWDLFRSVQEFSDILELVEKVPSVSRIDRKYVSRYVSRALKSLKGTGAVQQDEEGNAAVTPKGRQMKEYLARINKAIPGRWGRLEKTLSLLAAAAESPASGSVIAQRAGISPVLAKKYINKLDGDLFNTEREEDVITVTGLTKKGEEAASIFREMIYGEVAPAEDELVGEPEPAVEEAAERADSVSLLNTLESVYGNKHLLAALPEYEVSVRELSDLAGELRDNTLKKIPQFDELGLVRLRRGTPREKFYISATEDAVRVRDFIKRLESLAPTLNWCNAGRYLAVLSELKEDSLLSLESLGSNVGIHFTTAYEAVKALSRAGLLHETLSGRIGGSYCRELTDNGKKTLELLQEVYKHEKQLSEPAPGEEYVEQPPVEKPEPEFDGEISLKDLMTVQGKRDMLESLSGKTTLFADVADKSFADPYQQVNRLARKGFITKGGRGRARTVKASAKTDKALEILKAVEEEIAKHETGEAVESPDLHAIKHWARLLALFDKDSGISLKTVRNVTGLYHSRLRETVDSMEKWGLITVEDVHVRKSKRELTGMGESLLGVVNSYNLIDESLLGGIGPSEEAVPASEDDIFKERSGLNPKFAREFISVLRILNKNPRTPKTRIKDILGISEVKVSNRIKYLMNKGLLNVEGRGRVKMGRHTTKKRPTGKGLRLIERFGHYSELSEDELGQAIPPLPDDTLEKAKYAAPAPEDELVYTAPPLTEDAVEEAMESLNYEDIIRVKSRTKTLEVLLGYHGRALSELFSDRAVSPAALDNAKRSNLVQVVNKGKSYGMKYIEVEPSAAAALKLMASLDETASLNWSHTEDYYAILDFVSEFPSITLNDMGVEMGLSSASVRKRVQELVDAGMLSGKYVGKAQYARQVLPAGERLFKELERLGLSRDTARRERRKTERPCIDPSMIPDNLPPVSLKHKLGSVQTRAYAALLEGEVRPEDYSRVGMSKERLKEALDKLAEKGLASLEDSAYRVAGRPVYSRPLIEILEKVMRGEELGDDDVSSEKDEELLKLISKMPWLGPGGLGEEFGLVAQLISLALSPYVHRGYIQTDTLEDNKRVYVFTDKLKDMLELAEIIDREELDSMESRMHEFLVEAYKDILVLMAEIPTIPYSLISEELDISNSRLKTKIDWMARKGLIDDSNHVKKINTAALDVLMDKGLINERPDYEAYKTDLGESKLTSRDMRILELLKNDESITREKIAAELEVNERRLSKRIKKLRRKGMVDKDGSSVTQKGRAALITAKEEAEERERVGEKEWARSKREEMSERLEAINRDNEKLRALREKIKKRKKAEEKTAEEDYEDVKESKGIGTSEEKQKIVKEIADAEKRLEKLDLF